MNLVPETLAKRFLLVTVGAVFFAQLIVFILISIEMNDKIEEFDESYFGDPIVSAYHQTATEGDAFRKRFLAASSNVEMTLSVTDDPQGHVLGENDDDLFRKVGELVDAPILVEERLVGLSDIVHFWTSAEEDNCFIHNDPDQDSFDCPYWRLSLQYPDGRWMTVTGPPGPDSSFVIGPLFVSVVLTLLGITVVVAVLTRHLTAPLRRLSEAVDDIGRGVPISALPETGPKELSSVMAAFNEMQERVNRYVQDRTTMLAAISHDLRTPITSLRLRAEFVDDADLKDKIIESLDDMQTMVESFLTFARQEVTDEPQQNFDLVTMCTRMADDTVGMSFQSDKSECPCFGRRVSLQRALSNIVQNAIKYGGEARVSLHIQDKMATITVDDPGQGVPEDRLEDIFSPFVRLDNARSVLEGSVGLGLSIARSIIRKQGGDVKPVNTPEGFRMIISIPGSF